MEILYLGPDGGTSRHRACALARLGHAVHLVDPRRMLARSSLIDLVEWKVHPAPLAALVHPRVLREIRDRRFDLALVDSGSLVGPDLVQALKAQCMRVVNINVDDPFGHRDGVRFSAYRAAVPFYDLVVVVRKENVAEAHAWGARRVLHVFRAADEIEHAPRPIDDAIREQWKSDVAFVGTWMPERGPFLTRLVELGVPLAIFGGRWEKAPEHQPLRVALRTGHIEGDRYCYAIQCAQICIGLLSAGNRDLHTQRSLEIPSLGSVLCAQRTREHEDLYQDGFEAVFWDSAEECARVCTDLLRDPERRTEIARRGRLRNLANGHFNEALLRRVIDESCS